MLLWSREMSIGVESVTAAQADKIMLIEEGQFADVKGIEKAPKTLSKHLSAFSNADGGDLYIGIEEIGEHKTRQWRGFPNQEAANGHLQAFDEFFPFGTDFQYEFLKCEVRSGLVLHVQINKSREIRRASDGIPYVRRGASSLPVRTPEAMKRLEYAKGITSFEDHPTGVEKEIITDSPVTAEFIAEVVPTVAPEIWLKKQRLLVKDTPVVAGVLLFAEEPQSVIPKRCGIKITRYKTTEKDGFRESMAFTPKTVEGCLDEQIRKAVKATAEIAESIPMVGEQSLVSIKYPTEALHEIITNAVLHRDYSTTDDVHIRVFDDRIEVQSPGRLPAHVTVRNILGERFARNPSIVRILNKFPDPPNKDVGEGLNTAFAAMNNLGLKEPSIDEVGETVLVTIRHERLASAEEVILEFLKSNDTIRNAQARKITHTHGDYTIKEIFGKMVAKGLIEQVPGTRTGGTKYRLLRKSPDPTTAPQGTTP